MPRVAFDTLPGHARIWIFGVSRALTEGEEQEVLGAVDGFLEEWAAHGIPLRCAREWLHGRFLVVAVDEDAEAPSGCSIDALVRQLKELERRLDLTLVDGSAVFYREGEDVHHAARPSFRALVREGRVTRDTTVFDNSVIRLSQLREGAWERPARDSWHGQAFFRQRVG